MKGIGLGFQPDEESNSEQQASSESDSDKGYRFDR